MLRFTKIICTLGPSVDAPEHILHMATAGMNVSRVNLSHGSREQHRSFMRMVRDLNAQGALAKMNPSISCLSLLVDTKGAEIRTGECDPPVTIAKGQEVIFSFLEHPKERRPVILVNHEGFAGHVRRADRILIDNGKLSFGIISIEPDGTVVARAREDGTIGSRRHINLPGASVDLPPFTDRDWDDIAFAADEGADFIGLSFIQRGQEVEEVRAFLRKRGSTAGIVAKIETQHAVQNVSEILHAADALMVARGDLGAEVPFERVPVIQDEIVALCRGAGKPVIVATHMLESMIQNPMPTRAEVTDIAHAAAIGADATMLSGETASGKYPFAAIEAMDRVLRATEAHRKRFIPTEDAGVHNEREARAEAAVTLASSTSASALLVFTRSGQTAIDVSKFRPAIPIFACTDRPDVQRKLQLSFGVFPACIPLASDPEKSIENSFVALKGSSLLSSGDRIVLVSDTLAHEQTVNTVQLRVVP